MDIFDPQEPLLLPGRLTTVSEASAAVGYPVYVPMALPEELRSVTPQVWLAGGGFKEVGLRYGSRLVLIHDRWGPGQDPATRYARLAIEWGVGRTTEISGNPAWIVPANSHAPGRPPVSVVYVSMGRVEVTVYGRRESEMLVEVAASLASSE